MIEVCCVNGCQHKGTKRTIYLSNTRKDVFLCREHEYEFWQSGQTLFFKLNNVKEEYRNIKDLALKVNKIDKLE